MAVEALLQDQSKPFHRTYNPYGCLKSQATADTCLFATRLSKSVLLIKVSRRVCLDRKQLPSFCTKAMLKGPSPYEYIALLQDQIEKALLQDQIDKHCK